MMMTLVSFGNSLVHQPLHYTTLSPPSSLQLHLHYLHHLLLSLVDRQVGARQAGARTVPATDRNHLAAGQQQPDRHQDRGPYSGAQLEGPHGYYLGPVCVVSTAHQRDL